MKKQFLIIVMALLLVLPLINASLGDFKQSECVDVKTILNTSTVTISTLNYPNGSIAVTEEPMTNVAGKTFNYTFCDTSTLGTYNYDYYDADGDVYVNDFNITGNGNSEPSGIVIVLFTLIFISMLVYMTILVVTSLGHAIQLDFDMKDLAFNFGIYFGIVALYMLENTYLGNPSIHNILELVVRIGAVTSIFLPTIYFILTLTIGSYMEKRVKGVDY